MTRLLSFVCVVAACLIALYTVAKDRDLSAASVLCGTFLGVGMGAKVAQRSIESKEGEDEKK